MAEPQSFKFDDWRDAVLDFELGSGADADAIIHLWTVAPTASGGGTEYAGVSALTVDNDATTFPAASGGSKRNGIAFDFGGPTADGTIVGASVHDGSDNPRLFASFATPIVVTNGGPNIIIPVNTWTFREK